jgi:hypothetical protein
MPPLIHSIISENEIWLTSLKSKTCYITGGRQTCRMNGCNASWYDTGADLSFTRALNSKYILIIGQTNFAA